MKAIKYKIKPTPEQQAKLAVQFGHSRFVYNYCLSIKKEAFEEYGYSVSRYELQKMLPAMKRENQTSFLKEAHSQVLQSELLHLDNAFKNFFAKRAKFPKFKKKYGKQSFQYPQGVKTNDNLIFLPKVGWVKMVNHRVIEGKIKTVTVSKDSVGHYYASVLFDNNIEKPEKVKHINSHIGLDMGVKHFVIDNEGNKVTNPLFLKKQARNLKRKQQSLSRKKKGSNRRSKAKLLVAKSHNDVKNARNDFQHKLSYNIAKDNQLVSIEDLDIKGMLKNNKYAKHIMDLGWSEFTSKLAYKAEDRGHHVVKIDRFFPSSKTCNVCNHTVASLPLNIRSWECPSCHVTHDRDINAAKNIDNQGIIKLKAEGFTVSARGGLVNRVVRRVRPMKREAPVIATA